MDKQPDTDAPQIVDAADLPDPYSNTLSAEQAAAILNCSAQKVRRLAKEGKLSARKVTDKRGEAWRFDRVGPLAPKQQAEDLMAMVGAMIGGRDLADLVRMLVEEHQDDRRVIEALHEENARIREELAAERARAEVAMQLLASPPTSEPPKRRPWWRVWERDRL